MMDATLFSTLNPAECWVIGVIWADGGLDQRRPGQFRIGLNSVDEDLVQQFCEVTGRAYSSQQPSGNRQRVFRTTIGGEPVRRLMALGLHQRKSEDAELPNVPHEAAMVRGYFDGDGHIGVNAVRYPMASFRGSKATLIELRDIFTDAWGMATRRIGMDHPTVGRLQLTGQDPIRLGEYMYADGGPSLARKRVKFDRWAVNHG